ncbi:WW domain-containing protein WWM1 [Madurella mycetomatis]|uniref:WW domain-containing protein WWM1 n=1 Tax=Madurella mycetomatis TaxID=100816 RepID=A0A175VZM4_9PEZI|nr:WW domain-containing protein WWM1 [Madurella mycetomatis]
MSFFKKLADNLGEDLGRLGLGSDKDRKDEARPSGSARHYAPPQQYYPQGYGQPNPQSYPGQYHSPPPQGYYPPQHQPDVSSPPPPPQQVPYAYPPEPGPRPPPPYTPPADKPPIPAGWTPRWDDHYQRWYYVEDATGRSQWEAPGYNPETYSGEDVSRGHGTRYSPAGYGGHYSEHGSQNPVYGGQYPGSDSYQSGYGGHYSGRDSHSDPYSSDRKKGKKGSSGMLLGAAGGLAVGAVAGAVIAHEITEGDSSSDSEHGGHRTSYAPAPAPVSNTTIIYETNYYSSASPPEPAPGVLPVYNQEGEEVDSSDLESLREARDDYEEALADAADSDASSSEEEALEEAQEAYEEAYEEAYDEAYED